MTERRVGPSNERVTDDEASLPGFPYSEEEIDDLTRALGDELVTQVLGIGRPVRTEEDLRLIAGLLADEVLWSRRLIPRKPG